MCFQYSQAKTEQTVPANELSCNVVTLNRSLWCKLFLDIYNNNNI